MSQHVLADHKTLYIIDIIGFSRCISEFGNEGEALKPEAQSTQRLCFGSSG